MRPILKNVERGYNEDMETYVVELHINDADTGEDHFINLSQFDKYQRLCITKETIFPLTMMEISDETESAIDAVLDRIYEPEKPNDYYDEFDHTGYRRSVKFACYVLDEMMNGDDEEAVQLFIDEVTDMNLNTIYIPDVEGFVYKQKEIPLEEKNIVGREIYRSVLDEGLEALDAELMVMMDGAPVCLHVSFLYSEQYYVSYNSIMECIHETAKSVHDGDMLDAYYKAFEESETIASYETTEAAMKSEYRNYFALLERMLFSV